MTSENVKFNLTVRQYQITKWIVDLSTKVPSQNRSHQYREQTNWASSPKKHKTANSLAQKTNLISFDSLQICRLEKSRNIYATLSVLHNHFQKVIK